LIKLIKKLKTYIYTYFNVKLIAFSVDKPKVNGFSILSNQTYLGRNCHFNGMRIRGSGKVTIGDNFHSGEGCKIITTYHDFDNGESIPYGTSNIVKNLNIGDNVWFGDNVLVLSGISIAEGAIVQAGSVVTSNVGYCEIVGGSPAKCFKHRDISHYETLKAQNKFM
jgi:acetyltransferase-like isoleucine patch superfamily enzyme